MTTKIYIKWISLAALLVFVLMIVQAPLSGQYFGRNKVQYQKFDFKILKTKHFDVFYYPEFKAAADQAARMAERWYARISRILNHDLRGRQPLILYASNSHFSQTTIIPEIIGEGTGGVTESIKRRIILPLGASLYESDHVIGHELVHAFQYDMTSTGNPANGGAEPQVSRMPLWFVEGMAEYISIGPVDPHTAMWMRDVIRRDKLPKIKNLDNPRYFPYRYGQALWAYLTGRWGDEIIPRLMRGIGRTGDYLVGLEKILGVKQDQLSKDWHDALKKAYDPVLLASNVTDPSSQVMVKGTEENVYNVSPSVSPDGKQIMSLSTRDLFSVDMYLADVRTGRIEKRITKTATDPEFESLQFIRSSGSWESNGKRFVFSAVTKGRPVLTFYDVPGKKIIKEIPVAGMDEIMSPSWSPDSKRIVFSALNGGVTDLFIYDLEASSVKRMTNDSFSDLQPVWSPDSRSVAFVTDRFSTDLSILSLGEYELALLDPVSGEIRKVDGFPGAKNINPQWSQDSKSIYFLSDVKGKTDIYRVDLAVNRIFQVTNLYTGVSGITDMSPAISFAQDANELVYSAYDDGNYTLYSVSSADALQGKPSLAQFGTQNLAVLPPREQPGGAMLGLIRNPLFGLPEEETFPESGYKPKLALDFVATPQVAVGVDRFGTYGGGGLTLYWSDMLSYHTLATMVQTSSRLKETAALVAYQNTERRMNWGAVAQRIPYVTGYYNAYLDEKNGNPVEVYEESLFWQVNYDLAAFMSYPFNQVRRFELTGGYRYLGFEAEVIKDTYDYYSGMLMSHDIIDITGQYPSMKGLHMGYLSAAMVYDSALFGATGPVIGQSYVVQFSPTIGSISYNELMADYRRYFMPVRPFTLAFRFLHYGRYGKNAEDERLWPLYIGYDGLVRGYDYNSFDYNEFVGNGSFDFNRLFGSKMMIVNAEIRFPLFGVFGIGRGYYGVFPIDFIAFYDIGLAWDNLNKPWFMKDGVRKPIRSLGVGLRANMLGYFVIGVNYVKPLDRPNKGWIFQLSLMPGF